MSKKHKIIFSKFAENDLLEIIEYYNDINKSFAKNLFSSIEEKVQNLKNFPEQGKIVSELEKQNIIDYRELIEGNYRIIYTVQEDTIIIHTIIDSRRNLEDLLIQRLMRYHK